MKFGKVEDASSIDFTLPSDDPRTKLVLKKNKKGLQDVVIGCPRWSKSDLKNFYPKGTKDELSYYATQFNGIELNATFFSMPSAEQILTWKNKTPSNFKFFPKLTSSISHYRRLINVTDHVTQFAMSVLHFDKQLGMVFLQMHDNYKPKDYDRLEKFVKEWPQELPLAIELRNEEWFNDDEVFEKVMQLFEKHSITTIFVDTPGRRDLLRMRLTTPTVFIRFVSTGEDLDKKRIDDWMDRLTTWKEQGLENLYFFVHQNLENATTFLSAHLIEKVNSKWGTTLNVPHLIQK